MTEKRATPPPKTEVRLVAVIGAGVIGAGWVARFRMNGVHVRCYDPSPESSALLARIEAQARRALRRLTSAPLPERGTLRICESLAESLVGADWVQESVPEKEDLKKRVLSEIEETLGSSVPIGSSTSGLLPSRLQADLRHGERFFVAHPFNPVYLLPLVEIVGGARTHAGVLSRAERFYESLGMKALRVRKEVDAFLADRLLEAVWRESLWLIEEGVATTREIDDAIRFGFGLRWAQMGLFETYRIAGGKRGMKHFLEQFAPTLQLPWSRLTDVPLWSERLQQRILDQCEEQAQGRSVEELEAIRDNNLIGILAALKAERWGAGETWHNYEKALYARHALGEKGGRAASPLCLVARRVSSAWLDYNGHMTESRYLQLFSEASDALLELVGQDRAYLARGVSFYTKETQLRHLQEAHEGQQIEIETRVLYCDSKRLHILHEMRTSKKQQSLLATAEQMLLHVDRRAARSVPTLSPLKEKLEQLYALHRALERPRYAGGLFKPTRSP